ncbi:uncharacterized protein EKO05_0006856 [Ascochyta rabiei]|uniref:Uncharacterized protein n=1 Tax=Didymella rabiei TaxID=5454 RepID=A0A163J7Z3_DIDRA|nr:uncharacterized protein EKO05_0006856 [Ascochyta rabiei]KZM26204.1 hypothetical protein ST47_g2619 [Ascochyta rabiei]UPX16457.1 hypothetical protein EKO05_0006856 [Ascochyta rabiei]
MKITIFLTIGTLFTAAAASAPNPSNTNININAAPRPAIFKSRVSSTLDARALFRLTIAEHAALQDRSNAAHDASTDAVNARSAVSGMSRKARTQPRSNHQPTDSSRHSQRRTTDDNNEMRTRRSGMLKARRQRARSTEQQRRTLRFLPSRR